jgi:hypothetical protein
MLYQGGVTIQIGDPNHHPVNLTADEVEITQYP